MMNKKKEKINIFKRLSLFILLMFILVGCKEEVEKEKALMISLIEDKDENTAAREVYKGIKALDNQIDISYSKKNNHKEVIKEIERYIKRDVNYVITNNFLVNNEIEYIASQNKDIKFLVIDSLIDPTIENVHSVLFKTNESSFLAGYLAGMKSETNIVGYIGFEDGLISDSYKYGYKAGVKQASVDKNKEIKIYEKTLDSFNDYDLGYETADIMYENDVDIIYQTIGLTGIGVIDSAKKHDKYVIGYDIDQSKLAPKNVLTSTIKNYSSTSYSFLNSFINKQDLDNKIILGLKEKAVGITEFNEESIYSVETDNKLNIIKEKINSDQINVPYDKESYSKYLRNLKK